MKNYNQRHKNWQNALIPKGKEGEEITLAVNGKAKYGILVPDPPSTQEVKAAEDLKLWLDQMTSANFAIRNESEENNLNNVISIGETELKRKTDIPEQKAALGNEGYTIAVSDKNLFLAGGAWKGPINAVYALLEEDLGCRWYDEHSSSILSKKELIFSPVSRSYAPKFQVRDPYFYEAWNGNWSLHNRTASFEAPIPPEWGGHWKYPEKNIKDGGFLSHQETWFVHTAHFLVPPEKYFNSHPEYFTELNGTRYPRQLCLSNPEVVKISIEKVKQVLKETPDCRFISISHNDRQDYCECKECKSFDESEGSHSATIIRFINSIADAFKDEFPEVIFSTLAYQKTIKPPKNLKPRDNVYIFLCTDSHAWGFPFIPMSESEKLSKILSSWENIGANILIWDYTVNFSHYCLPMPNMQVVRENIRFLHKRKVKGIMFESADTSFGGENAKMKSWTWSKQLWDPSLNMKALMQDFIYGYYGKAAEPVYDYNNMLWNIWEEYHRENPSRFSNPIYEIRYAPDIPFLSEKFLQKSLNLFQEAEKLAGEDEELARRIRLAKLPVLYTKLCQEIGTVIIKPSRFWVGNRSRLKAVLAGKTHNVDYAPIIDEVEKTVQEENITMFGGALKRFEKERTNAEIWIQAWREMSAKIPDFTIHEINNEWKFKPDENNIGIQKKWFDAELDDSHWNVINTDLDKSGVGGHVGWESQGYPQNLHIGWYRQKVEIPENFDTRKLLHLVFLIVKREAEVWINGIKVYEHNRQTTGLPDNEIGVNEMPFSFDVRPYLDFEKSNLIAVKVNTWTDISDTRGGICKPVVFLSTDEEMVPRAQTILIQCALQMKNGKVDHK